MTNEEAAVLAGLPPLTDEQRRGILALPATGRPVWSSELPEAEALRPLRGSIVHIGVASSVYGPPPWNIGLTRFGIALQEALRGVK